MEKENVYAVAKKPLLSRDVSTDYSHADLMWQLYDLHINHGGSPIIKGVCTLDATDGIKEIPRYKLEFPDGFIDYARIDNFHEWYEMKIQ